MADPQVTNLDPETLAFAQRAFGLARAGDTATLADLLEGGLPVNLTNDAGDTLLILAAYHGHTSTVMTLLDHGADVSRVNDRGQSALAAATFRSDREAVEALLAAGADPAAGRQSALATAAVFDLPEMAAVLRGEGGCGAVR